MLQITKIVLLLCSVMTGLLITVTTRAQSLTGNTGLATIPTARLQEDGTLSFGFSYFDKKHQQYFEGTKDFGAAYVNLTFLPFLEVVMRVNRPIPYHSTYTVDRFPMLKIRLLKEKKYLPAVAVGMVNVQLPVMVTVCTVPLVNDRVCVVPELPMATTDST